MAELKPCPFCGGEAGSVVTPKTKLKTHFAKIIVCGTSEKPYFNILYFDSTDGLYHVGFGSYCLNYVFQRLNDEFDICERETYCTGCVWKGTRHQKCSCCRRNLYMKDNYKHYNPLHAKRGRSDDGQASD